MKRNISPFVLMFLSAVVAIGLYILAQKLFFPEERNDSTVIRKVTDSSPEFTAAADAATPAVVHIKTTYSNTASDPLRDFFGLPSQPGPSARGSGSGVTISEDGYIATNNHVVENASAIEVIYPDKRVFTAKLVGRDPSTDLALIKVDGNRLPTIKYGNSDEVSVGEWALAIGYPFSLNTTVTAGIISAKGRSIGILNQPRRQSNYSEEETPAGSPVESFIQTDAAINPGNSGGALVNTKGELIGINAAIASQTGSYAGYGFAIPVNLARKILGDLREFGEVRRGFLGVTFPAPATEEQFLRQQGIDPASVNGVLITGVQDGSAADEAGIQTGDIIRSIDGVTITSSAEFSERIARHRPDDQVELTILRNGKTRKVSPKLKGEVSLTAGGNSIQSLDEIHEKLGASFAPLLPEYRQRFMIRSGLVVTEVRRGGLMEQVGITEGTVIVMVNGRRVNSIEDLNTVLTSAQNSRIRIDGIAPDGSRIMVTFSLGA